MDKYEQNDFFKRERGLAVEGLKAFISKYDFPTVHITTQKVFNIFKQFFLQLFTRRGKYSNFL